MQVTSAAGEAPGSMAALSEGTRVADPGEGVGAGARPTRGDVAAELALAAVLAWILLLLLVRGGGAALPAALRGDPSPWLALALLLAAFRAGRNGGPRGAGPGPGLRPGRWLAGLRGPDLLLLAALAVVLHVFHHHGARVRGDGKAVFATLRSALLGGDLDLADEWAVLGVPGHVDPSILPPHEPGTALLWAPFFLAAHALARAGSAGGLGLVPDGYSAPYANAVGLAGVAFGFLAAWLAYRIASRYVARGLAAAGVCTFWFASTLLWYTALEPATPHGLAAGVVAVLVWLWLEQRRRPRAGRWIAIGATGGLLFGIQRYDVVYLLPPLISAAALLGGPATERRASRRTLAALAAAFLAAALPLVLYDRLLSASLLASDNLLDFGLRFWRTPQVGAFLFSSNHGLFAWTPAAYAAVLGLLWLGRLDRALAATLTLTLVAAVYLLSSTWDWDAGHAFGSRRLTEAFVILALGFCAALDWALRRPRLLLAAVAAPVVLWNLALAAQVRAGDVPAQGTVPFSAAAQRAVARLYALAGHPGAFPAPLLFRLRYGVAGDAFDAVYGGRRYGDVAIAIGAPGDEQILGRGWSRPERDAGGATFRWSDAAESTLLIPLHVATDYVLMLEGSPPRHPAGWEQTVGVAVNGGAVGTLALERGTHRRYLPAPARFWKPGINEVLLRYGWTVTASEAYGGGDRRPLALRLSRVELVPQYELARERRRARRGPPEGEPEDGVP